MPRNVAVQRPDARIIRRGLEHDIRGAARRRRGQQLDVAALGVVRVRDRHAAPGPVADGLDEDVVAVEVHGMRGGDGVVDDEAVGVGAEVVDVPLRGGGVGGVAGFGEEEGGVVVVAAVGAVVHGPFPDGRGVGGDGDGKFLGCGGDAGGEGEGGGRGGEGFVDAGGRVGLRGGGGDRGG